MPCAEQSVPRVDLPTPRHAAPTAQNTLKSRPLRFPYGSPTVYGKWDLCVGPGIVASHALIAQRACSSDLHCMVHMQHAGQHERDEQHARHAQAPFHGARLNLRHGSSSTSAYRLLRNHLVHSPSFEAQQTRPAARASCRCLHICQADTGVISNPKAPWPSPQPACPRGLLDRNASVAFNPPNSALCRSPPPAASHRLCWWPRGGLVRSSQDGISASQHCRPSLLQPWAPQCPPSPRPHKPRRQNRLRHSLEASGTSPAV